MSLIGYKVCQSYGIRVVVTLEIPDDAKTNITRDDIVDKRYAKYRCDKAKVIDIEDCLGRKYSMAFSRFYRGYPSSKYILGEVITEKNYNEDVNVVCGEGIHFFIDKDVAFLYGLDSTIRRYYEDRKLHGEYKEWWDNGQLMIQGYYTNGKLHGEYKTWWDNGQLDTQCMYSNGLRTGEYTSWHKNGKLQLKKTYVDGKEQGEYKSWSDNGQLIQDSIYVDGELRTFKMWNKDGKLNIVGENKSMWDSIKEIFSVIRW